MMMRNEFGEAQLFNPGDRVFDLACQQPAIVLAAEWTDDCCLIYTLDAGPISRDYPDRTRTVYEIVGICAHCGGPGYPDGRHLDCGDAPFTKALMAQAQATAA